MLRTLAKSLSLFILINSTVQGGLLPSKTASVTPSPSILQAFPNLTVVTHPLIQHKLTIMRDKATGTLLFGQLLREIALLLGYEVTRSLAVKEKIVETPVATAKGFAIDENEIVIVPIIRAGLGMADGLHTLIPTASQGHIGLYRDPVSKQAIEYFFKIPTVNNQTFIIVDPMLATGNSLLAAIDGLVKRGVAPEKIIVMTLVSVIDGVRTVSAKYPKVRIFTAAVDEKLNDHAYIIPGLGDAGDRLFRTK